MQATFREFLIELETAAEMRAVENHLTQMFSDMGVSKAVFTGHGGNDRALGREMDVTPKEISELFFKFKKLHGEKLVKELNGPRGRMQAVIKDYSSQLNVVVDFDGGMLKIVTMKRKPPNQFKGDKWPSFLQLKVW